MSARIGLRLAALAFAGFAVWACVSVSSMLGLVGITYAGVVGETELRAFYGGAEIGMAVYLWMASYKPSWWQPAMAAALAIFAGCALTRLAGLLVSGQFDTYNLISFSGESAAALMSIWVLRWGHQIKRSDEINLQP